MQNLRVNEIFYGFKNFTFSETSDKIEKILKDNGYDVKYVAPSHYCEFGGLNIKWGE